MPRPRGAVIYGKSIHVTRANGQPDVVDSWSAFVAPGHESAAQSSGLILESSQVEVEAIDDSTFKVKATGEVLTRVGE